MLIKHINLSINLFPGCFTDCFNPGQIYSGIRSATENGEVCQDWKKNDYKSERSNICSVTSYREPWCYFGGNAWRACSVPKCSTVDYGTGCVTHPNMVEKTNAVRLFWSSPDKGDPVIGYLILLHNTDHFCEQYHLQLKENSITESKLEKTIKSFYLSCRSKQEIQPIRNKAYFSDLHQNRTFFVYIIPIISKSRSGEIQNVTVQTPLAKPDVPRLSIKSESLREMFLSWERQKESKEHGAASHYLIKERKGKEEEEMKIQKEGMKLQQLEMCSKYCFRLSSVNEAGSSGFSKEICSQTLAPKPGIVNLDDLKSGFMRTQAVSWSYSGSDECLRTYRIENWDKYKGKRKDVLAIGSSTELKSLVTNAIYVVRVRAEGLMKTLNNENIGNYSPEKQFYTGDTELEFSHYIESLADSLKSLNIIWGIQERMRGSIFEVFVLVKDSSGMCQGLIHLTCDACDEPKNQMYLTPEQNDKRLNLLKCKPVQNKEFSPEDIHFNYSMKFKNAISNFSVEIYGINLMGVNLLHKKSQILGKSKVPTIITMLVVMIILLVCLVIGAVICIKKLKKKKEFSENIYLSDLDEVEE